jgi:hypothetical protein
MISLSLPVSGIKRTFHVEGILHLSSRVLLRHEHGVEVPESRLDELVGWHLGETKIPGRSSVLAEHIILVFVVHAHPMSKKICLNSSLTLSRGCRAPPSVGSPRAAMLYFLN